MSHVKRITPTVEAVDMSGDLGVVNAARVSFNVWKNELDTRDKRLIKYLVEHNHSSPFHHPQVSFRITAPIYVARQLFRHEVGAAKNEVSRRYVTEDPTFSENLWRERPETNIKQGSGEALNEDDQTTANAIQQKAFQNALDAYQTLLVKGVAPEQARSVLPQGTNTTWIWSGSLAFFARVCRSRLSHDAQQETQAIAQQISDHMYEKFPVSWPLLIDQARPVATVEYVNQKGETVTARIGRDRNSIP